MFRSPACRAGTHFMTCAKRCECWCHKSPARITLAQPSPPEKRKRDPFITVLVMLIICTAAALAVLVILL